MMQQPTTCLLVAILLLLPVSLWAQEETIPETFREALELIRDDDIPAAIAKLEELRASGDAPLPALATLGALYVETGRPQEALEVLAPLAEADNAQPAVLYNAGRAAAALGDLELAARYLHRSSKMMPNSPAGREFGLLIARQGFDEDAYAFLRPWALQNPDDTEARLAAALIAVRLERAPDAEQLLSDLPQDDPGVRLLWGQVLLIKGDPWGALSYLKPLLDDSPAAMETDLRRSVAKAYIAVGEASSAIEMLEGRVGDDPSTALQLSLAYYQSGELEAALATLEPFAETVLDSDAETAPRLLIEVALEYGRLMVLVGRREESIPFLRFATRHSPERAQAWQSLGQALAAAGQIEEAQVALARFQELSQQQPPESVNQMERDLADPTGAALRRAKERFQEGEIEEALEIVGREARLASEDPRPPMLASRFLLVAEEPEQALAAADLAASLAPQNPDAHYQRGVVLMSLQRLEQAEVELREALKLAPDHTAALSDLAVLLANSNRVDEARSLLERVLELRPNDSVVRQNLERLESRD